MFYSSQDNKFQKEYIDNLTIIGTLSNLFSDSKTPYLYYRIAEKIFCNSFNANDLSRGDIALDAAKNNIGIGLKTFLKSNDRSMQKVAEFNKDRNLYKDVNDTSIVNIISELRNKRINFAEKISNVNHSFYHCVIRGENKFYLYEEKMDLINLENIQNIKKKQNSIWFNDGLHEYSFNLSKSTLLKRFHTNNLLEEFEVKILENPLEDIKNCFGQNDKLFKEDNFISETIYLPLYSKGKIVPQGSGLNQWNGKGRKRDSNEIYIPIPSKVHKYSPNFFPPRDEPFSLILPNKEVLNVKVCQDSSKALMSNPNKALGKWLLRDVLELKEEELLTYQKLQLLGIDSVRIDKINNEIFTISFASLDSYENYLETFEKNGN